MKGFIGLVLGAILVTTLLAGGAIAFGRASTVVVTVHPAEEYGVTRYSVDPNPDRLGIVISLTIAQAQKTTVVLQRSTDRAGDAWQDVVTIPPGSEHYVSENEIEYLDENVEHSVEYTYRVLLADSEGGSGQYVLDTVMARDPAK